MRVDPVYTSVGRLFGHQPIFRVPKYQRSYAWDKLEIEDFIQDLENCFRRRKANTPINHFFGGIVSVEHSVPGTVNQSEFELVDGQQRMATFVLLVSTIIALYKKLLVVVQAANDAGNVSIIERRIKDLQERFIEFEQEVNRITHTVDVLKLSRADEHVFRDLVRQNAIIPTRDSHSKLQYAYDELTKKVEELAGTTSLNDQLDNLEILKQLIDADFSLIHIKTQDKKEAYVLFRVLNDRGKSLTDGDLLRARTLELLEGHNTQQTSVEILWDDILSDIPATTEEYMRWIYSSHKGTRPGANTLFDDCLDQFYPQHRLQLINAAEADQILRSTQSLLKEVQNCRKLTNGEWPFPIARPVTLWDANRLTLLIRELRLTMTMPVLLAACHLDQAKFSEIVQILERFMFRFKIVGNQHVTPVITILHSESISIRSNPAAYNANALRTRLNTLQLSKVNDTIFRNQLDTMLYKDGGGNYPIKYLLMTIEHYLRWYRNGAAGEPTCLDKTRIYEFPITTIEHIYPKNAHSPVLNAVLEPLKNTLGNLTFMGPADNALGANDGFAIKKPIFQASSVLLNTEIGQKPQWTEVEINNRITDLKDIACAVFNI